MRTLVYKRTHNGDPDEFGRFGIYDCMGQVRGYDFKAVIGIGGAGAEAASCGIDGQVNWVGIGPTRTPLRGARGPLVTFQHFVCWFDEPGPDLRRVAPNLARRMYARHAPRYLLGDFTSVETAEISRLLELAEAEPASAVPPRLLRAKRADRRPARC